MLYSLYLAFGDSFPLFNLFRYITFRSGAAVMTALLVSFVFGPSLIAWLKSRQGEGQPIREDGPPSHLLTKKGTPTMGGSLILLSLTISTLLCADLSNPYVWIVLGVTACFGLVGFVDDYIKVMRRRSRGLRGRTRLLIEAAIAVVAGLCIVAVAPEGLEYRLAVPFFKDFLLYLGPIAFLGFAAFVVVGSSNAVNLTDGLDGLAIVPVMIAAACFAIISYLVGHTIFAEYLQIHYVSGTGELTVLCAALVGASLGFLWFNAPPAEIYMGDTGSLACGGALGSMAVITRHELVLAIIGGLFVLETVSVCIQVASFKLTGKRIFRMAPLHHHYEQKGWAEPTIVIRFWIIAVILALVGLSTLKLR